MYTSIAKQLRRLFLGLAGVLLGLLFVLLASMHVTNTRLKLALAEQVAREARNVILTGDYRAALGTLRASLGAGFLGAVYKSQDGGIILDATQSQGGGYEISNGTRTTPFLYWLDGEIEVPLSTTPRDVLGVIAFRYDRTEGAGVWIASWFGISVLSVFLSIKAKRAILARHDLELEHRNSQAIARTTQALAHDVRKPFSMFKSIIQIVEGTEDPSQVREVLNLTLPEVNQAMASVEGMIQDVMQIGAEARLVCEEVSPSALLGTAVNEIIRVHPQADVTISYRLTHEHQVVVDTARLSRVFANILGNAIQAMHEKGEIWVHTLEREGFVEFVLGNTDSYIPNESLPKLFDAFFTAGKKGGTGLGLAIAKKIVEAHGGTICCRSERSREHPNGMVEFVFTLPAARSLDIFSGVELPPSSKQVHEQHARLRMAAVQEGQPDTREVELVAEVERKLLACEFERKKFNILVVDDEAVYRDGMRSLLARFQPLAKHVEFFTSTNANESMELARRMSPNLIIEDVDLGQSSANGLDIVRALRAEGFSGHICVHSNRFLQEDNKAAIAAGADSVLPKPLSRVHFLKLILASLPTDSREMVSTSSPEPASQKMTVALLDDSISMRMSWKMELEDECNFRAFGNTDSFFELCDKEPGYLSSLDVVITDYNFAPGDPHDGGTLARALRERGYDGLILRASGESDLGAEIEALFDGDVGKSALEWAEFEEVVTMARRKRQTV